jgi:hypothetical protein
VSAPLKSIYQQHFNRLSRGFTYLVMAQKIREMPSTACGLLFGVIFGRPPLAPSMCVGGGKKENKHSKRTDQGLKRRHASASICESIFTKGEKCHSK